MRWLFFAACFVDVTDEVGIRFVHRHGGGGDKHMMETIGGGAGFFDYDLDGDLDIYFPNGAARPGYEGPEPLTNALYRNEGGRFVDVTEKAGLLEPGYSMGLAAADVDNDGDLDLYVTSFGSNRLYRNNGDGTFSDVTERAGVGDRGFGTSAAFGDIDNDGYVDLYAANYVEYDMDHPLYCGNLADGVRSYCHPNNFEGSPGVLYLNNRDGTFADISQDAGIALPRGKGLGVLFSDLDTDGDLDIYVANDTVMNFLFVNQGEHRFVESALIAGVGFGEDGRAEGSMGLDAGDFDGDARIDLFLTNYEFETNTLYRNRGDGSFADVTTAFGLAVASLPWVGFGTRFFDFDHDGDLDIFVANGHIMDHEAFLSDATSYRQRNQLFENREGGFVDISSASGEHFVREDVSRAAAFGDWDDDGDVDVLVANNDARPNLLRNDAATGNHWTSLRLVGRSSNRDGIGARVLVAAGGATRAAELLSGASYLSTNDLRLHFGLGPSALVDRVVIQWPTGNEQTFSDLPADRRVLILEGHDPRVLQ